MRRRYIKIPSPPGQIHSRFAGDVGPWLFFVHQFPLSCRQFERLIPKLGIRCRAFGLDLPGYGVSPAPERGWSISDYARALLGAVDVLEADTFAVVGIETGVAVAAELAAQARSRVSGAIFLSAPPLWTIERKRYIAALGTPDQAQDGGHLKKEWDRFAARWGPDCDKPQLRMAAAETFYVYGRYHWGIEAFEKYDLEGALTALSCPTLFLCAALDPLSQHAEQAATHVSGARHEVLPGIKPAASWTAPDAVAAAIARFLGL